MESHIGRNELVAPIGSLPSSRQIHCRLTVRTRERVARLISGAIGYASSRTFAKTWLRALQEVKKFVTNATGNQQGDK